MLKEFKVIKTIIPFITPYLVLYALYIQLNGEVSPGGGFQAGVIFATAIISYDLIFCKRKPPSHFLHDALIICATIGVMIYAGTGVISLIFDYNYLDYDSITQIYNSHPELIHSHPELDSGSSAEMLNQVQDDALGQHIGIFSIELGVGLTVASIMCLIYSLLRKD